MYICVSVCVCEEMQQRVGASAVLLHTDVSPRCRSDELHTQYVYVSISACAGACCGARRSSDLLNVLFSRCGARLRESASGHRAMFEFFTRILGLCPSAVASPSSSAYTFYTLGGDTLQRKRERESERCLHLVDRA